MKKLLMLILLMPMVAFAGQANLSGRSGQMPATIDTVCVDGVVFVVVRTREGVAVEQMMVKSTAFAGPLIVPVKCEESGK